MKSSIFHATLLLTLCVLLDCQKVEQAGGKKMSEVEAEGEHGLMQHFEDTEGNYLGMYMQKPKMEAE